MTVKEALAKKNELCYVLGMGLKSGVIQEKSDQQEVLESVIKKLRNLIDLAVLPESDDLQALLINSSEIQEQINKKVDLTQIGA